jgi:hypothetical protein
VEHFGYLMQVYDVRFVYAEEGIGQECFVHFKGSCIEVLGSVVEVEQGAVSAAFNVAQVGGVYEFYAAAVVYGDAPWFLPAGYFFFESLQPLPIFGHELGVVCVGSASLHHALYCFYQVVLVYGFQYVVQGPVFKSAYGIVFKGRYKHHKIVRVAQGFEQFEAFCARWHTYVKEEQFGLGFCK